MDANKKVRPAPAPCSGCGCEHDEIHNPTDTCATCNGGSAYHLPTPAPLLAVKRKRERCILCKEWSRVGENHMCCKCSGKPPQQRKNELISYEEANRILQYDSRTGIFIWRIDRNKIIPSGKVAGHRNKEGYITIFMHGAAYKAHRLAWLLTHGVWPNNQIDHVNGIRDDNRIENLRDVTNQQNQHYSTKVPKHSTSGVRGVSWHKTKKKWCAHIILSGKFIHLGTFDTKESAHESYISARIKLHGGGNG